MSTNELTQIIHAVVERLRRPENSRDDSLPWAACIFDDCTDPGLVDCYGIQEPTDIPPDPNRKSP